MSRTRLLFILPSLRRAGAETQMVDLINTLDRNKWDITVVVFLDELSLLDRLNTVDIDFQLIPRRGKLSFSYICKIRQLIQSKRIQIIHCTLQFSLLVASLALVGIRKKDKPDIIAAIHTTVNVDMKNELADKYLYSHCLRHSKHVIFVCEVQREYWIKRFPWMTQKSSVVYNGVDTNYFNPNNCNDDKKKIYSDLSLNNNDKIILCIAGFRTEKGHDKLLRVFAQLPLTTKLLLGGDGPTRITMEKYAKDIGIADRVVFLGNVADVRPYLCAAQLTVLASTAVETFSIAMLESMSMGKPMVAPDIGGLKEAISLQPENGQIYEIGNENELQKALVTWLLKSSCDPDNKIRNCVQEKFSVSVMTNRTESLLLEQLN